MLLYFCVYCSYTAQPNAICVSADLPGIRASKSPLSIYCSIPSLLMVTPYRPDIVLYSEMNCTVALFELTCPLDSFQHLESARDHKPSKEEYLQILSKLDQLSIWYYWDQCSGTLFTIFVVSIVSMFSRSISKSQCRKILNYTAGISISSSR